MKMLIIAEDFVKNVIVIDQNRKVQNDSCNLSESFISSFNWPCRELFISSNSIEATGVDSCVFLSSHYAHYFSSMINLWELLLLG